ncbi:MAG: hypothetical protein K0A94_04365 [Desulfuromonadales bacterium]|nr:hypothetical protein [Desulfuromonadales bacterium]
MGVTIQLYPCTGSGILCQGTLFVIHDRFLSPSMATKTLATGSKGPVLNRYKWVNNK